MRKIIKALIFILLLAAPLPSQAKADSAVSINELVSDARVYDGLTVTINGEAVGESMKRGDYSWVNINDGTNAIGVWLSNEEADKITSYGDYKHIGDIHTTSAPTCKLTSAISASSVDTTTRLIDSA
jgi:endonuclease YncB( thermonuclease family)